MDAISFVLGVRSAQLRSSQLKDLIYRAGIHDDDNVDTIQDDNDEQENGRGEKVARKAWVQAVYKDRKGKEWSYRRT